MNGLDLFSGIGGLSIALKDYVNPIAYCEIDPYCQAVLLSRMGDGILQTAPIWDDVRTLGKESGSFPSSFIDIIYAGFPCQNISIAGAGKGLAGEQSRLFFEILRLCSKIRPKWLFLENVPAITRRGGEEVVRSITSLGYDCRWCVISAASVGAKHKRERWFLLAYSKSERLHETGQPLRKKAAQPIVNNEIEYDIWDKEPEDKFALARMADGLSVRSHAVKALGNAVVPAQARKAFRILSGLA